MRFRPHKRELRAGILALSVAAIGSLWGWAFSTAGQVPWWTYFVVSMVSAFLVAYWLMDMWQGPLPLANTSHPSPTEEEMRNLQEAATYRREFLTNISHELKTSVFVVQGFLDALEDDRKLLSKPQRRLLERARSNLDQLAQLVEDVLTTSLMESGAVRMQYGRFCMRRLSEQLLEDFYKSSKSMQLKLHIDAPADCYVLADKKYIRQVMRNLIHNAIRYNRSKGSVKVHIEQKSKLVKISVIDTGIGIPVAEQPRVFERFYRVEKSRSKDHGGTGIGLALVKYVLEAHRSKILMQSELGVGTVFSFQLPMAEGGPQKSGKSNDNSIG